MYCLENNILLISEADVSGTFWNENTTQVNSTAWSIQHTCTFILTLLTCKMSPKNNTCIRNCIFKRADIFSCCFIFYFQAQHL